MIGARIFFAVLLFFAAHVHAKDERPNVVFIVVDDMRRDEFAAGGHPYVETPSIDSLAREGAMFTNAYHVTPLCSPNRASLLTGQYASRHGIIDNASRSVASHRLNLFPKVLQQAGYVTAHVGKWHMGNDPTPRPGYDYWVSFPGQGTHVDPQLYENGGLHKVNGYTTDLLTERAVSFVKSPAVRDHPFFLYLAHKALHPESEQRDDGSVALEGKRGYVVAPRHVGRYDDKTFERPRNFGFSDLDRNKFVLGEMLRLKQSPEIQKAFANILDGQTSEQTIRRRAEMMLAVDEGLGRVLNALREVNKLDNTLIIFTSDNGFFYGEHGLSVERRLPYEESVKAPLLMRYPPMIKRGSRIEGLTASIDLAPTVLEIAGAPVPPAVQGTSLLPLLKSQRKEVRDAVLMEYYSYENPYPWMVDTDYRAIRKGKYKYIDWLRFEGKNELYDLERDPLEQANLINSPHMGPVVQQLRRDLGTLVLQSMELN